MFLDSSTVLSFLLLSLRLRTAHADQIKLMGCQVKAEMKGDGFSFVAVLFFSEVENEHHAQTWKAKA